MISKLISGVFEHFSTEIQNNNSKLDLIINKVTSFMYTKCQVYINTCISLYFVLLFICLLNLIINLFKN
jgi:hypothetical protein